MLRKQSIHYVNSVGLHVVESGEGHRLPQESPEGFNSRLIAFIRTL